MEANQAGAKAIDVPVNPLSADIQAQVSTSLVEMKEVSFHFRKDSDLEKANPELKDKTKRTTFKLPVPLLTKAGLIAALQAGDKSSELALEKANEAIIDRTRGLISDKIENDTFDKEKKVWGITLALSDVELDKLSFLAIANLPKSERGAGISKETWAAFTTDYVETMQKQEAIALMPDKKARTPEVLAKHAQILGGKFNQVRSRKDVIGQMLGFLDIWMQTTSNADDHLACYEHLVAKGKVLMEGESFNDL